jgi:hypothetical protein
MAVQITKYTSYLQYVHSGEITLTDTGKVMLALVTSGYTPSITHTIWSPGTNDSADPAYNEVTNGAGYTTNGAVVAGLSVNATRFDASDVVWTGLTKVFRYGVLYLNDTYLTIIKPLIAYILFDSTPANITMTGGDFTVQWSGSGIITFS